MRMMSPFTDINQEISEEPAQGKARPSATTMVSGTERSLNSANTKSFKPIPKDKYSPLVSPIQKICSVYQPDHSVNSNSNCFKLWWSGISCDEILVAEIAYDFSCSEFKCKDAIKTIETYRHKSGPTYSLSTINKLRTQLLKEKEIAIEQNILRIGWNFVSYAIKESRIIQGAKFHVYQKIPFKPGSYVIVHGFSQGGNHAHLNGLLASVIEYLETKDKYLIKIAAKQEQTHHHDKSNTSEQYLNDSSETEPSTAIAPMMIMNSKNIRLCCRCDEKSNQKKNLRTWKFATLFSCKSGVDGRQIACSFIETILGTVNKSRLLVMQPSMTGSKKQAYFHRDQSSHLFQDQLGPMLQNQMERYNQKDKIGNIFNIINGGNFHNEEHIIMENFPNSKFFTQANIVIQQELIEDNSL